MTEIDIRESATVSCAGGRLRFDPDGHVTLFGVGGFPYSVAVIDLKLSNFVELWCSNNWACFLGLKSRVPWGVWPAIGKLSQVAQLDRLDLQEHYDPGGLHRVEFHELPGGDLLVVHEVGLARINPSGILCWQQVHDQLAAQFDRCDGDVVWFHGEYERFGFSLVNGRPFHP